MSKSDWKGLYLLFRIGEYAELENEANEHGLPLYRYLHILIDSGRQFFFAEHSLFDEN